MLLNCERGVYKIGESKEGMKRREDSMEGA